ncbi:MAG: Trk system potassium transporter TrkA [Candidatus Electryonea clarkiae]|nr:Trk system potassium transporter TrkA [Candidatus Electryonea clarkiae]MDP8287728.1 Trk system potassium transporter TrkA [Candidatus Electryonea clarkiae]
MKIILVGAGAVGGHLAGLISRENHDITVIDNDPEKIASISESLDVLPIVGNGTSPNLLSEAGIAKADMLIAVTAVDEVNILACMIARQFGVKTKIARVRNREFSLEQEVLSPSSLGIDMIIHPELEATNEIVRLIRFPQALEIIPFCKGGIVIVGIRVMEGSPIAGKSLIDIDRVVSDVDFRLIAITRDGTGIIPHGKDHVQYDDIVYVSCRPENMNDMFMMTGQKEGESRHVMIYGASAIGRMVAEKLASDKRVHIKVIEGDKHRGKLAAEELENVMVVIGEASNLDLITQEGIIDQDVFVALTDDDENNIVTSLLARHLKVPKTITLVGKSDYVPIVKTIGLDITINANVLTSNAIFKYIRHKGVISLRHMIGIKGETIEFLVDAKSQIVGKQIKDIKFPPGSIVVAIEHEHGPEIPVGSTNIYIGDKVVIFCLSESVKAVLKLFG